MEKNKKKNKWYIVGGILSLLAGISYLFAREYTSGVIFLALGGLYIFMSTIKMPSKKYKGIDRDVVGKDEIFNVLMQNGKKNAAIKRVRKLTNCEWLNAEKFVDDQLKK